VIHNGSTQKIDLQPMLLLQVGEFPHSSTVTTTATGSHSLKE
jgi:hypothetical protein